MSIQTQGSRSGTNSWLGILRSGSAHDRKEVKLHLPSVIIESQSDQAVDEWKSNNAMENVEGDLPQMPAADESLNKPDAKKEKKKTKKKRKKKRLYTNHYILRMQSSKNWRTCGTTITKL